MEQKKAFGLAAAAGVGMVAIAAVAFALAPERRGLASLDLDNDGQILNSEIQQSALERFNRLDSNEDGKLVGEELPRGRHGGRHDRRDADRDRAALRQGLADDDSNNDGAIDLREFYARHAARAARADANKDGTISAEELATHRSRRGRHGN